jgi:hypothetical protein
LTEHTRLGRGAASRVKDALDDAPHIKAITIGGSVAVGIADPCSDVDMYVFCDQLPSEALVREHVASLDGTWWTWAIRKTGSSRRATFGVNEERMDLNYVLVSYVESELDRVLINHDWRNQNFVGGFYDCLPLAEVVL